VFLRSAPGATGRSTGRRPREGRV